MHVLGLANGTPNGNNEIALKAALKATQDADPSITTSWVHVPSISIPLNAKPLKGSQDISVGGNKGMLVGAQHAMQNVPDDRQALLDALLDADAYIFSTPVYSHSPAGSLKAVFDRVCGPFTDAAFADTALEKQKAGDPRFAQMKIDVRLLKPRVAGFIAIGGSTTRDQFTMALPILHTLVYPMHVKVVDQVVLMNCASPGVIIARSGGEYVERAMQLGRNVASQLGKRFDEAEYLGEQAEGACPYCHLTKVDLLGGSENRMVCVACGAQGRLEGREDGTIRPVWDEHCCVSSITWLGKKNHIDDLQRGHSSEAADMQNCADFEVQREKWRMFTLPPVRLPSQSVYAVS